MKGISKYLVQVHRSNGQQGILSESLRGEWDALWKSSPCANMFNSSGWFVSACESFRYRDRAVITIRNAKSGKMVGVLPLVRMKKYGISAYGLPGEEFVDRFSFLADMTVGAIFQEIISQLKELGTVFFVGLTEADVQVCLKQKKNIWFFPMDENPYIDCSQPGVFPNIRKSRSMRKAERKFGTIGFIHALENHTKLLKEAFKIDQLSSRDSKGKSTFWREGSRTFFLSLLKECPSCVFVDLLSFSDIPVAYSIGFKCNGVYACSQKAHLAEYDRYRPGGLAFQKFLEVVSSEGVREVDIGRGNDAFKRDFTNTTRILHGAVLSNNVFFGRYIREMFRWRRILYGIVADFPRVYRLYKRIKFF